MSKKGNGDGVSGNGGGYHVEDATVLLTGRHVDNLVDSLRAVGHQIVRLQQTCSELSQSQHLLMGLMNAQTIAVQQQTAALERLTLLLHEVTTIEVERKSSPLATVG